MRRRTALGRTTSSSVGSRVATATSTALSSTSKWLARQAEAGAGKRPFGVWLEGRLCGYIDYDPDNQDGIERDDVNLSYSVHPWARGQGVAVQAVGLVCDILRERGIGRRAAIRVEPENHRSVRVAEKAGFTCVGDFASSTDKHPDGSPVVLSLYLLDL